MSIRMAGLAGVYLALAGGCEVVTYLNGAPASRAGSTAAGSRDG